MRDTSPAINTEEDAHGPRLNEMSLKFIADCTAEKERLLPDDFPVAAMLLDEAIERVYATGRIPGREMYADVFKQKQIKVAQKVFVPVRQFPKFNFQGKILGPKGNSLRNLQKETMCRVLIKGRNSIRDSKKEEELRQSGDPQHNHLNKDLYVEISTIARPAEAHARIAYALAEIRKFLIPDSNDEVSQNQRKEILADPELSKKARKTFVGDRGGDHDQIAMSILKKINAFSGNSSAREHDDDDEPSTAPRSALIRPPMKRNMTEQSWSESNSYYKKRNGEPETSSGRPSILKKLGYQSQGHDMEDHYDDPDEQYYEQKPIRRMPQRSMQQRFDEPSILDRKYETPQKRSRESQPYRNSSGYGSRNY